MEALSRLLVSPAAARFVRVGASATAGRALYTTVPIAAGEVFVDDPPLAFAMREQPSADLQFSPPLFALDERLRGQSLNVPRLAMRCAVRVADEVVASSELPSSAPPSSTWEQLRHLARPRLDGQYEDVLRALHEAHAATRVFDAQRWCDLLGVLHINTFRLEHGSAIFAAASMINHSCEPNAAFGVGNEFVALEPMHEGQEITVAYCDVSLATEERKAFLAWNYGFDCRCPRCQ